MPGRKERWGRGGGDRHVFVLARHVWLVDVTEMHSRTAILLWLCVCHFIGLFIFVQGFFLTRYELPNKSNCSIPIPDGSTLLYVMYFQSRHSDACDCYVAFCNFELRMLI
jgi:hypothetical protein